jgi:hypothetical protein
MCHLPRFQRVDKVAPIKLTERNYEIIRLIHRHRFLRSSVMAPKAPFTV